MRTSRFPARSQATLMLHTHRTPLRWGACAAANYSTTAHTILDLQKQGLFPHILHSQSKRSSLPSSHHISHIISPCRGHLLEGEGEEAARGRRWWPKRWYGPSASPTGTCKSFPFAPAAHLSSYTGPPTRVYELSFSPSLRQRSKLKHHPMMRPSCQRHPPSSSSWSSCKQCRRGRGHRQRRRR